MLRVQDAGGPVYHGPRLPRGQAIVASSTAGQISLFRPPGPRAAPACRVSYGEGRRLGRAGQPASRLPRHPMAGIPLEPKSRSLDRTGVVRAPVNRGATERRCRPGRGDCSEVAVRSGLARGEGIETLHHKETVADPSPYYLCPMVAFRMMRRLGADGTGLFGSGSGRYRGRRPLGWTACRACRHRYRLG
jgi:hypothetical protein